MKLFVYFRIVCVVLLWMFPISDITKTRNIVKIKRFIKSNHLYIYADSIKRFSRIKHFSYLTSENLHLCVGFIVLKSVLVFCCFF